MSAPATFTVRHVHLARAAFAAIAALMITFSPDHSAAVGLSVFSGSVIATALLLFLAAWLVAAADDRWPYVLLGTIGLAAGIVSGIPPLRTTAMFFGVVIAWAVLSGLVELLAGIRSRRPGDSLGRDRITVGVTSLVLALALLLVPQGYSYSYIAPDGNAYTLTGITLAVGIFGAYAAIVAVYLGIAGLTPRRVPTVTLAPADAVEGEIA